MCVCACTLKKTSRERDTRQQRHNQPKKHQSTTKTTRTPTHSTPHTQAHRGTNTATQILSGIETNKKKERRELGGEEREERDKIVWKSEGKWGGFGLKKEGEGRRRKSKKGYANENGDRRSRETTRRRRERGLNHWTRRR